MTVTLFNTPKPQFHVLGEPASGYKLFSYEAGTTTKLDTFTTAAGDIANTNPIVLDSDGYPPSSIYTTDNTAYKFVLAPSTDTDPPASPVWTEDNVLTDFDATRITFTQDGTGAVETTVDAKLNEMISVKDFGAVGDGSVDDTLAIQAAIDHVDSLTSGSAVLEGIPALNLGGGTYNVTSQLTCPTSKWCLISDGNAVIKVDSLAVSTPPFDNFVRGSVIKNVIIRDTTAARTRYGWNFDSTSGLVLDNLGAGGLAKGFIFNDTHDFRGIRGLNSYANTNDIVFETTICSSLIFDSCRFDECLGSCVDVNATLTNVHFINCGFIMAPTTDNVVNVNIDTQHMNACSFKGNRFEHKGTGLTATHLYIKGASATYPAHVDVEGNYFTSSDIDQHIHLDGYINRAPIENNHFQTEPNTADILNSASNDNLDVREDNTAAPSRATSGDITAFADAGGGQVTVTSAAHGIPMDGRQITITGTTSYDGTFAVTNITTNTFEITDTWVADDATGAFTALAYVVFSDTALPFYIKPRVKPILIKLDRVGFPTTATGSQTVTITYASETRVPDIDMPNAITDYKLYFRGMSTGTPILDGEPTADKVWKDQMRFRYNVRTAVAASEAQFDLYIWGY